jgi:hypothetical protein
VIRGDKGYRGGRGSGRVEDWGPARWAEMQKEPDDPEEPDEPEAPDAR